MTPMTSGIFLPSPLASERASGALAAGRKKSALAVRNPKSKEAGSRPRGVLRQARASGSLIEMRQNRVLKRPFVRAQRCEQSRRKSESVAEMDNSRHYGGQ
jgi:hypothetical protein